MNDSIRRLSAGRVPGSRGAVSWVTSLVILAAVLTGCGHLQTPGPYNADKVLYDADLLIASSYDLLHNFVTFEFQNRAILASDPAIKQAADRVRAGAPRWFGSALALRDAYKASPNDPNKTALLAALDIIRAATAEVTKYLVAQPMPGGITLAAPIPIKP